LAAPAEIARDQTDLDPDGFGHLHRLMGSWGMLADLSFGDLLLFVPTSPAPPEGGMSFVVLGQMRPSTGQTLHQEDLVGSVLPEARRPLVALAWRLGEIVEGKADLSGEGELARIQCIPIRWQGRLLGVLGRESDLGVGRRPGELERVYVDLFDRFADMIVNGLFPFPGDEAPEEYPRVGDGLVVLDEGRRVSYASPNAVNALHRMGVHSNVVGTTLDEQGVEEAAVERSFLSRLPVIEEVERRPDVIVLLTCIPLVHVGRLSGALVLMRDVTDLRRRDRLLVSKDATIREVHHRVKNNLQTISSLLRLQARRLASAEGRTALREAERRIRSIAIVHEILSRDVGDQVPFDEIVQSLISMTEDGLGGRRIGLTVLGDAGELPADVATPLAVVVAELLQNAVEHAFGEWTGQVTTERVGRVELTLGHDGRRVVVTVRDDGQGLPEGFSIQDTTSLGLSIVRDLVTGQLEGKIAMFTDGGTVVDLEIPVSRKLTGS